MYRVRFILKNGCTFTVFCDDAKVSSVAGVLTGYTLTGITQNKPLFLAIEQVAAVIVENPTEEKTEGVGPTELGGIS